MKFRLAAVSLLATGAMLAVPGAAFAQAPQAAQGQAALSVSTKAVVAYTVNVKTSNLSGAGTDATVQVRIHGTNGVTGWLNLDNSSDNFERNDYDQFTFYLSDLGTLSYVELYFGDDNDDSDWSLDYISINSANSYGFYPYYNWLRTRGTTNLAKG